jgi:hypothetical protein
MSGDALMKAVREGQTIEVTGLLDAMTDAERRACLPALKELRKELRSAPWSPGSRKAYPALHAAGAACHGGAAGAATWIAASDMRWSQASPGVLLHVLDDREPDWLGDLTHRLAERPVTSRIPYVLLAGLVKLSGGDVPTTDAYVEGWVEHIGSTWHHGGGGTVVERLRQEPHLAQMVAALFESVEVTGRVAWLFGDGPGSWFNALAQLAREGTLGRKLMVDACVARLLRGGTPADQRVFLRLLTCLDLTREEERERSADWTALASDATSTVAWHAQSVLAALALDGELTPRQLAEMSSGVLFRTEKKLVRAQLMLLGKVLRRDPSTASELLPAAAQAFGHEDTEMQERALKLVERHFGRLEAADGVREELVDAAAQLSQGLRTRAGQLFGAGTLDSAPVVHEEVLPPVPERTRLAPPPGSVSEVAEEVGALLASGGELDAFERTLDGLVRHAYQDRQGLAEALQPVTARCWWATAEPDYIDRYFRANVHDFELILATLLGATRTGSLHDAVQRGGAGSHCVHSGLADPFHARLREVAHRIRIEPLPFLLATPTWSTGLLEAADLVERLDTYRRLGARPGQADFAQALLRVRRDDRVSAEAAAVRARELGTAEGERLAQWLTYEGPVLPLSRRRTSGVRILVELGELDETQPSFPPEFRVLGHPLTPFKEHQYCGHWVAMEARHWLGVLPGRRELVAARMLRDLSAVAVGEIRGGAALLPPLAEADGEAGEAVHLCLAYGLGARHPEDRLSAVDALLVLAARGQLDAGRLGADLGQLVRRGAVKPLRLAESIRTAAATGAYATVWAVLRDALPILLADLATEGASTTPARGLGDLLAVAAECAERSGARGEFPHLSQAAGRRGSSTLVTQARRLRTALTQPAAA